jgi:hypothetical protein
MAWLNGLAITMKISNAANSGTLALAGLNSQNLTNAGSRKTSGSGCAAVTRVRYWCRIAFII